MGRRKRRERPPAVDCPQCGALPGRPCVSNPSRNHPNGRPRGTHYVRQPNPAIEARAVAATGCPVCKAPPGASCRDRTGKPRGAHFYRRDRLRKAAT